MTIGEEIALLNDLIGRNRVQWIEAQEWLPPNASLQGKIEMVFGAALDYLLERNDPLEAWLIIFRSVNEADTHSENDVREALLQIADRRNGP